MVHLLGLHWKIMEGHPQKMQLLKTYQMMEIPGAAILISDNYSRVPNNTVGNLILFWMFFPFLFRTSQLLIFYYFSHFLTIDFLRQFTIKSFLFFLSNNWWAKSLLMNICTQRGQTVGDLSKISHLELHLMIFKEMIPSYIFIRYSFFY